MTSIKWNETFSVNVDEIDEQHKVLIKLFNDLGSAMVEGKGKEIVKNTLAELVEYTEDHFSNEEKLMAKYQYPDYGSHKKAHDELKKKVMVFYERRNDEGFVLRLEIVYFLKNWLQSHILDIDKKLGAYISSRMQEEG